MDKKQTILILNPNSNDEVTEKMAQALEAVYCPDSVSFVCETLTSGPFGIESDDDIELVIQPVCDRVLNGNEDATVIACYSDPGLMELRSRTSKPVFGIQESGIQTAIAHHDKFGVLALSEASKARHLKYIEDLGYLDRLAGEYVANLSVAESAGGDGTFSKLLEAGEHLRDFDDADVVIMGCAGMARHRGRLSKALNIEVIDPVQAATTRAVAAIS